jgi:hypothetical protein
MFTLPPHDGASSAFFPFTCILREDMVIASGKMHWYRIQGELTSPNTHTNYLREVGAG